MQHRWCTNDSLLITNVGYYYLILTRYHESTITIPDFSSITLPRHILTKAMEPGSIVIADSTGLKV
jgi:hypothetical protein